MTGQIIAMLGIIGFALFMYVLLDGYDLGIGMLLPFAGSDKHRLQAMELIDNAWDANESWIILLGVALWGGFPIVYASVLPANYLFIIFMILGFVARGMSLEFQGQYESYNKGWGLVFALASLLVTVCQGAILGEVLSSFRKGAVAGTPIVFICIGATILIYGINGMTWQFIKTEGKLEDTSAKIAKRLILLLFAGAVPVLWFLHGLWPGYGTIKSAVLTAALLMALLLYAAIFILVGMKKLKLYRLPFIGCCLINFLMIASLGIYLYPYTPSGLTVQNAMSPSPSTLTFIITGISLCMPVVLTYNLYALYVFRGRKNAED